MDILLDPVAASPQMSEFEMKDPENGDELLWADLLDDALDVGVFDPDAGAGAGTHTETDPLARMRAAR
jgi:hypothetical protein